jgi:peroxiredoxin
VSVLPAGSPVPEFTLRRENLSEFTREDLPDGTSVLVFYPFAFSPVCTDQLNVYEEVLPELRELGATLFAISCDAPPAQAAFRRQLGVSIEHLSDFEPKGATCAAFGVLHPGGFAQRALVLIRAGVVTWSYEAPSPDDLPGVNLIFDGLAVAV